MKKIPLIGTRTRDLPACGIVPQPTTLLRAPMGIYASQIRKGMKEENDTNTKNEVKLLQTLFSDVTSGLRLWRRDARIMANSSETVVATALWGEGEALELRHIIIHTHTSCNPDLRSWTLSNLLLLYSEGRLLETLNSILCTRAIQSNGQQ
jgi:hypothetical protein